MLVARVLMNTRAYNYMYIYNPVMFPVATAVWICSVSSVQYSLAPRRQSAQLCSWQLGGSAASSRWRIACTQLRRPLGFNYRSHLGRLGLKPVVYLRNLLYEDSQGCAMHGLTQCVPFLCGRVSGAVRRQVLSQKPSQIVPRSEAEVSC